MRKLHLGQILVITITICATILLLPRFQFRIGDNLFTWQGVDLSLLGVNSTLANFRLGEGIYSDVVIGMTATYPTTATEAFAQDVDVINRRLQVAGFKDVRLVQQKSETETKLQMIFPNYYTQERAQVYAQLASSPGVIEFWEHDPTLSDDQVQSSLILPQISPDYKAKSAQVSVSDLIGLNVETRSNLVDSSGEKVQGTVWRLRFSNDAQGRVATMFAAQDSTHPALLVIDNEPAFVVQSIPNSSDLIALPLFFSDYDALKIMSTYYSVSGNMFAQMQLGDTGIASAVYAQEGRTWLAVSLAVSFPLLLLWNWRKYKARGVWVFAWSVGSVLAVGLGLLKLGAQPISVTMLIAVWLVYLLTIVATLKLMQSPNLDDLSRQLTTYRHTGLFLFFWGWLVFNFGFAFGVIQELAIVMAVMVMGLVAATFTSYRFFISDWVINRQLHGTNA